MAITEKIKEDEWHLYEILRHPALFGEFYRNIDKPEQTEEFEYSQYQKEYLCDFQTHQSLCCGRAVGKTLSITDFILRILINNSFPNEYILYTVPNRAHLEPVFTNLVKFFRTNSLLKNFIEPKRGINSSNYSVTTLVASNLLCRIAGTSGTGANVVGLHTPIVILDEAGYYPWGTWLELQPVLNTFQDGHKMWVSGVPTGLRENNVLYFADDVSEEYSKHRTSAHDNPRYSEEDEARNQKQYGNIDSDDYIHFVLGRHGSPVFAVFDRRLMDIQPYAVHKVTFSGIDVSTYADMIQRLSAIPPVPDNDLTIMGIDLGYTEPTSIVILYEKRGIIKEHCRINLYKVDYPIQERLIDWLDTRFGRPQVIGVDVGNEQGLAQHLMLDDGYLHKDYPKRLIPVKFGAWIVIGEDELRNEIKIKVKPHAVALLQEYTNSHKIMYSTTDLDLVTEMERMIYTKTANGEIVYKTLTPKGGKRGEDHNTAAMLCAVFAYSQLVDIRNINPKKKELARSRWV